MLKLCFSARKLTFEHQFMISWILSFRSGSTFTGKLLESGDPSITSYNHEPLKEFTQKLELAWHEEDYHRASKGVNKEFWDLFLSITDLFSQSTTHFPDLSRTFHSHLEKRFQSEGKRIKIEKTIRLRWHHIEDWIGDNDIKVRRTSRSLKSCYTFFPLLR